MASALTTPATLWAEIVADFEAIEARVGPDITDDLCELAGVLITKLMKMPAPHSEAVQWKLDWILNCDGGSTGSYEAHYVAQMKTDYRRFLTGKGL